MTYAEKLKDPRWQKKRLEVLQRDNFTCQQCSDDESTLHVHHLTYSHTKNPWDVDIDQLLTLCEHCHAIIEYNRKSTFKFKSILKRDLSSGGKLIIVTYIDGDNDQCIDFYKYMEGVIELRLTVLSSTIDAVSELNNVMMYG